ncbi:MAG: MarR family transcriptional regulator [Mycobacterium sp.]
MVDSGCADSFPVAPAPLVPDRHLPELDDLEQECWQQFTESATRIGDVLQRTLLFEHNLTLHDVMLLWILAKSDSGSVRMGDLATALALIPSRVTQQAGRLEARGLLTRSTSETDRRGVVATITRVGRVHLAPALRTYAGVVRSLYLNPLSRQQMTALGDSCRRIGAGLLQQDRRPKPGHN